jgi:hypothetical protein
VSSPVAATVVSRKRAFFAIGSSSVTSRSGRSSRRLAASGIPGKPPPDPRSRTPCWRRGGDQRAAREAVDHVTEGDHGGFADPR